MKKYVTIIILILAVALQGCSGKKNETPDPVSSVVDDSTAGEVKETDMAEDKSDSTETAEDATAADKSTETADDKDDKTATPTEAAADENQLVLPLITNDSGKVRIQTVSKSSSYKYNSYIITSVNGESVVVDPTDMPSVSVVDINPAAILVTHNHPDHTDSTFEKQYDCQKLLYTEGEIDTEDFHIYTVKASHGSDTIDGSDIIMVFEVDGLRIAHMGDIGQTALTDEQLKELGEIDIAFMQFENSYSNMSLSNGKALAMMDQLKPKIIIPTHYSTNALTYFKDNYGSFTDYDNILEISKEELPEQPLTIYRVLNTHKYN